MQRLILPINRAKVSAGYKVAAYKKHFGFAHYGLDMGSAEGNTTVYACGNGTVIATGMDGKHDKDRLGNCIVIVYKDVLLPNGVQCDLSSRMYHFAKIQCKAGDIVTKDTLIGQYGNTGANGTGAHLHIEFDTDVQWPCHAVGIAASGNVIKKGSVDSSVNPSTVWFCDKNQSVTTNQSNLTDGWCSQGDISIPALPLDQDEALRGEIERLMAEQAYLLEELHKRDAVLTEFKALAAKI